MGLKWSCVSGAIFFVLLNRAAAHYFSAMEGIRMRFATKILEEEWQDLNKRQTDAIRRKTTRRTGNLEDNRGYSVKQQGGSKTVATLRHPVYERFLDMRKNYMGDWKTKWGTRQDLMVRKPGIAIHNRIIFGKLNPISFRLMHELADQVREYVRARFSKQKK